MPLVQREAVVPFGRGAQDLPPFDGGSAEPVGVPGVRPRLSAVAGQADRDVQRVALVGERGLDLRAAPTPQEPQRQVADSAVVPVVWTQPARPSPGPGGLPGDEPVVQPVVQPGAYAAGLPVQRVTVAGAGQPLSGPGDVPVVQRSGGGGAESGSGSGSYGPGPSVQRLGLSGAERPLSGQDRPPGAGPDARGLLPVSGRDTGDLAVAAGIGSREPDGSIAFAAPATVQRAPDAPAPPAPQATAPPAPEAQPPPGAPAQAVAAGESTDELVRRLLAPLTRLLRAELRLDRERAGMRLDSRH